MAGSAPRVSGPARPAAVAHIAAIAPESESQRQGTHAFFFFFPESKPRTVSRIRRINRISYRMGKYGRQKTISSSPELNVILGSTSDFLSGFLFFNARGKNAI